MPSYMKKQRLRLTRLFRQTHSQHSSELFQQQVKLSTEYRPHMEQNQSACRVGSLQWQSKTTHIGQREVDLPMQFYLFNVDALPTSDLLTSVGNCPIRGGKFGAL
mmetsp:Transcript_24905/g.48991  ORF Transcript_24905/g.48991 Transcript_24905/m.48991 type:complete len:105 (-) Transcript_24905:9-323(-)